MDIEEKLRPYRDNIPSFKGIYIKDYDIYKMDKELLDVLVNENKILKNKFKEKINNLELELKKPMFPIKKRLLTKELSEVKSLFEYINSNHRINEFKNESKIILEKYPGRNKKISTITFGGTEDDENMNMNSKLSNKDILRLSIIEKYFDFARKYSNIYIKRKIIKDDNKYCDVCGSILDDTNIEKYEIICLECGNICKDFSYIPNYSKENNTWDTKEDDSINNFKTKILKYQGLQKDKIPPNICEELDKYFIKIGRPTGSEIKKLPLKKNRLRGDTNHVMLRHALGKIGMPDLYSDVNLVGHIYWGWELPNLEKYMDLIMDIYRETQKYFRMLPNHLRERSSSLGTEFRLFKTLQLIGFPCSIEEFKISNNEQSIRNHYRMWKFMCDSSPREDIYYIED